MALGTVVFFALATGVSAQAKWMPWTGWAPMTGMPAFEYRIRCNSEESSGTWEWEAAVHNGSAETFDGWRAIAELSVEPESPGSVAAKRSGAWGSIKIKAGETLTGEWGDLYEYLAVPCSGNRGVSFWLTKENPIHMGGSSSSRQPPPPSGDTATPGYNTSTIEYLPNNDYIENGVRYHHVRCGEAYGGTTGGVVNLPPVESCTPNDRAGRHTRVAPRHSGYNGPIHSGYLPPASVARGPAAGVLAAQALQKMNVKGLDVTSAALDVLSTGSPVSEGFANSMIGGGLLIDIIRAITGRKHGNPDGRPPFNQAQFQAGANRANRAVAQYERRVDATRRQLSGKTMTRFPSFSLAQPGPQVATLWGRLKHAKLDARLADSAIDAYGSQIDRDLSRQSTPLSLSFVTTQDELAAVAASCSQGAFIRAGLVTWVRSAGQAAGLFEEMANATGACAASAQGERKTLLQSWQAVFLNKANEGSRKIGADREFVRTRQKILSIVNGITNSKNASPKYRNAAAAAWQTFCTNNSPEKGPAFPDYGRLELWPQWHRDCDKAAKI